MSDEFSVAQFFDDGTHELGAESELGLTPGIGLMIVLSPTEARRFAQALCNVADKAEVGLPRA